MPQAKQALIVDDDQALAVELKSLLNSLGFKVTMVQDPAQATQVLGARQYQLALMNMTLPEMTWRRTLRTVKNASLTTTVMMITRTADEGEFRQALNAGAYISLDRPLTQGQLAQLIASQSDGLFVLLRD